MQSLQVGSVTAPLFWQLPNWPLSENTPSNFIMDSSYFRSRIRCFLLPKKFWFPIAKKCYVHDLGMPWLLGPIIVLRPFQRRDEQIKEQTKTGILPETLQADQGLSLLLWKSPFQDIKNLWFILSLRILNMPLSFLLQQCTAVNVWN